MMIEAAPDFAPQLATITRGTRSGPLMAHTAEVLAQSRASLIRALTVYAPEQVRGEAAEIVIFNTSCRSINGVVF